MKFETKSSQMSFFVHSLHTSATTFLWTPWHIMFGVLELFEVPIKRSDSQGARI